MTGSPMAPSERRVGCLLPNRVWIAAPADAGTGASRRAALVLDRDGVVVDLVDHLHRVEDVRLAPGAAALIAAANARGVPVVVVTNQSGIDRGLFGWFAFQAVETEIARQLAAQGGWIDAVAACPFHPDHTAGYGPEHDRWRKPGPGMLTALAARLGLELGRSWLVGDSVGDILAARNAGLPGAVHVLTGHGHRDREAALACATAGFTVIPADAPGGGRVVLDRLAAGPDP